MSRDTVDGVTELFLRAAILDTNMCMRGARIHPFHFFLAGVLQSELSERYTCCKCEGRKRICPSVSSCA